ncbi:MAG: CPBP family intramembrane metalloprotease [Dehalococcoidia bacterium]|nr:CPBP family intramembrane metalloprotease [Dehalococcoidia bacterium]
MIKLFRQELQAIGSFFRRNYRELVVIGLATLFLTLDRYHPIGPSWVSSLIYFAVLPVITITVILRRNPLDFGIRLGNFKAWSFYVVVTFIVALPILYIASRSSFLAAYYIVPQFNVVKYSIETTVYLFAWEFLFRGFLLFGLKNKLKESSILVQMVPFVLLHFGKPEIETISTILTGIYFGYVAYRGNSYWPAFIIHLFINIVFLIFVNIL